MERLNGGTAEQWNNKTMEPPKKRAARLVFLFSETDGYNVNAIEFHKGPTFVALFDLV